MGYLADDSYCAFYVPSQEGQLAALREEWESVRVAGPRHVALSFSQPAELHFLGDDDSWETVMAAFPEAFLLFVDDQNLAYRHAIGVEAVRRIEFTEGRWTRLQGAVEPWEAKAGVSAERSDIDPFEVAAAIGAHFGFVPCPPEEG